MLYEVITRHRNPCIGQMPGTYEPIAAIIPFAYKYKPALACQRIFLPHHQLDHFLSNRSARILLV